MKKIEAIVRPHLVEAVKDALGSIGIQGMTIVEVKGFGRQKGHTGSYRGSEYQIEFINKIKIEIVLDEDLLDETLDAIIKAARTGKLGDGKIFVLDVETAMRIRTGEYNNQAV